MKCDQKKAEFKLWIIKSASKQTAVLKILTLRFCEVLVIYYIFKEN